MPDPNHPEVKAEMLRLRAAPPQWRKQNRSAHAVIDLEYFFLEEGYSRYIRDSLDFLKSTWHRREKRQGLSWEQVCSVSRRIGKKSRNRKRVAWPRKAAWAYMSHEGDFIQCDYRECHMLVSSTCTAYLETLPYTPTSASGKTCFAALSTFAAVAESAKYSSMEAATKKFACETG